MSKDIKSFFSVNPSSSNARPNDSSSKQVINSILETDSEVEYDEVVASCSKKRNSRDTTPEKKKRIRGESTIKLAHRAQKYRKDWENDEMFASWIGPVKESKAKALCRLCKTTMLAEITVIKRHAASKKHIKLVKGVSTGSKPNTVVCSLENFVNPSNAEKTHETNVKVAEIKLSAFLAEHNISLNSADHLVQAIKSSFHDSNIAKSVTLGRTKATSVIKNVIGQGSFEEISKHMQNHRFSLIIDETTDISRTKSLCICVLYFDEKEKKVVTRFWKLIDIFVGSEPEVVQKGACAERIFDLIIENLNKENIPLSNVVGFASDGCNTMMGEFNSVQQKLTKEMPGIIVQKCICHSIHLCASTACRALPRSCEDLARNIYAVFKNSNKRIAMLQEFQHFCEVEPHKILRLSQTRWLSLESVVHRILEQWDALKLFFCNTWFEERLNAAETIYVSLQDPFTKMFYFFLDWVLPKFNSLNKLFQGEKVLITYMHSRMQRDYKDLLCSYMKRDYVMKTNLSQINPANESQFLSPSIMYLGVNVLNALQDEDICKEKGKVDDFMVRCRSFLVITCQELKKRYDFDDPVFSKLHILDTKHAMSKEVTRQPSLLPLMKLLPRICNSRNYQIIDDQWRKLPDSLPEETFMNSDTEPDIFWANLLELKNHSGENEFKEIAQFALDVMVLPHSSASCERVFSKVNLMKTKSRNKLQTPVLNGLLHTDQSVKRRGCYNFEPSQSMLKSMTSSNLYGVSKQKGKSAVPREEALVTEFSEDDIFMGLSSDSD
jgi:hypothetical protein